MNLKKIDLYSNISQSLTAFLTDILEWDLLKSLESSKTFRAHELDWEVHFVNQASGKNHFELHVDLEEFKDIKRRLEFFCYSNPIFKEDLPFVFSDLSLKKIQKLELKGRDNISWTILGL